MPGCSSSPAQGSATRPGPQDRHPAKSLTQGIVHATNKCFSPVLPGTYFYDRIRRLARPGPRQLAAFARLPKRLNAFLTEAAGAARGRFGGPLTYASGTRDDGRTSGGLTVSVRRLPAAAT
jgi:hypothetical protein